MQITLKNGGESKDKKVQFHAGWWYRVLEVLKGKGVVIAINRLDKVYVPFDNIKEIY